MVNYMNKNKKSIVIFNVFLLLIILLTTFISLHYTKNISFFDYDIKYVESIQSDLYQSVKLYKYNERSNNYEINETYILKEEILYHVFYYYNNDLDYNLSGFNIDDTTVHIKLENDNKEIDLLIFKLMKLSYESIQINKLIISYNNQEYIIS